MNFALTEEQEFLQEAARGALSRVRTVEAAREGLEGSALPDLWDAAVEAGWPGLLVSEANDGAGLEPLDAMLVFAELGRVLASVPLLGHLPATYVLDRAGADASLVRALASGARRAAIVPARPPSDVVPEWTVDGLEGARVAAPTVETGGHAGSAGSAGAGPIGAGSDAQGAGADGGSAGADAAVSGTVAWVPDAPGADVLVVVGVGSSGQPVAAVVEADAAGVTVEPVVRYDATRSLGHVTFDGAAATVLPLFASAAAPAVSAGSSGGDPAPAGTSPSGPDAELAAGEPGAVLAAAWHVGQTLLAAESLGAAQAALELGVAYAKERFTFGRAIGSYQSVKHSLVEILRRTDNGVSLMYYAGWAGADQPEELAVAASAFRLVAGQALEDASRTLISVHGGIGATFEHDAPLWFRKAQLSRRLLGGTAGAADGVAGELFAQSRTA